ncbi:ATP-binding cassette domain-containing protein [Streptomyces olivaceus]|uniref:ATP-binding cassette domain-containing protein n=1 Tax=Streptomyces olivaceus TaxID=47716 RepID=UPI003813DC35
MSTPAMDPLLVMKEIGIRFGAAMPVKHISLTVRRGETVALTGPSGAGKTTVLRTAAGLLAPTTGTVLHGPAAQYTTLFQDPRLLPWRTVRQNVFYGLGRRPTQTETERAERLLDRLGLTAAASLRPGEVSGGMQRRAALVRALVPAPDLLLADEPFAHLDPEWSDEVERLLTATAESGSGVLLAAHQPDRIRRLATKTVPVAPQRQSALTCEPSSTPADGRP